MRRSIAVLLACAGIAWTTTAHAAPKCPANAVAASSRIWPEGTLAPGQAQSANHPCGQRLECIGGNTARGGSSKRSCRWAS
jgi:hypothetical protein